MSSKLFPKRFVAVLLFVSIIGLAAVWRFGAKSEANFSPAAPVITATNNDALVVDVSGDGRVDPGDTIEYTVTVNNTAGVGAGNDALNVQFNEMLDANTTLVPNTLNASPITTDESFNVIGNVSITVPNGAADLLGNDYDPETSNNSTLTASAGATSAQGGNVTVNSDGSFTYNPPPGYTGTDSFTYTARDRGGDGIANNADDATTTGTVTLNISGMIWFVQNGAANCTTLAAGCGRLSNPFSSLAAFQALNNNTGNNPANNDNIFLYESGAPYTGGVTLLIGQNLIGQDATASLAAIANVIPTSFTAALPAMDSGNGVVTNIQNSGGNGVTLAASGNTLRGFTAGNSSGASIAGTNFGTPLILEVIINTNGQALNLNNGTVSGAGFTSITSTGGATNISLTSVTGVALGTGALSGATSNSFDVDGGTGTITFSGTISNSAGKQVEVTNKPGGSVTLSGAISGTGTGVNLTSNSGATITIQGGLALSANASTAFNASGGGTINICNKNPCNTGAAVVNNISSTSGKALDIDAVTLTMQLGTVSSSSATQGVELTNLGAGTTFTAGTTNINSRTGTGIFIDNVPGTVSFGATTIPNPGNAGGYGIRVEDSSAAVTFASATVSDANMTTAQTDSGGIPGNDGDGDGIFLKNNTGAFTLNGGTISNCGNDCLDIRNSTGLTLSGVNITNSGVDVINMSGVGVGGNGAQIISVGGTVSITGSTFSNINSVGHFGIYSVNQSATATFTVQGTTFQNSVGAAAIAAITEGTGNSTFTVGGPTNNAATNCTFSNILASAIIANTNGNATMNTTIQRSTFQNSPTDGKTNITGGTSISGTASINILNNTFTNVFKTASTGEGLISLAGGNSVTAGNFSVTVTGNVINGVGSSSAVCAGGGVACAGPLNAILVLPSALSAVPNTILIDSNDILNAQQGGIMIDMSNTGAGTTNVNAKITNNCVGKIRSGGTCTGADAPVGAATNGTTLSGIRVERRKNNSPSGNVLVSGNTVRNGVGQSGNTLNAPGIFARTKANSNLSITVTSNNVDTNLTGGVAEMRFDTNANEVGDIVAPVECDDISGNTLPAGAAAVIDINEANGTHNVEQASSAAVSAANSNASVTADAGVSFNVPCAAPPPSTPPVDENAFNTNNKSVEDLSFLSVAYELPFDVLATHKPLLKQSANAERIPNAEIGKASVEAVPETNVPSYWASISTLFSEVFDKFGAAISPTVEAQRKKDNPKLAQTANGETNAPQSGETVNIGAPGGFALPATKSVTIKFRATINNVVGLTQVSTQGAVSGSNFGTIQTDDPAVNVAPPDPTVTVIDSTTVAVSSNANPSVFGQNVTFTATMTGVPSRASDPPGTVQFKADGNAIGAAVPVVVGAVGDNVSTAQASISTLSVGSHVITAEYSGGGAGATGYNASIGTLAAGQVVNKAGTTVGIVSSQNPSLTGQSITFTATAGVTAPGAGTPTGTVSFTDGGNPIAGCTNVALTGVTAGCTTSALTAGNHTIAAQYGGDGNFNIGSGNLTGNPQVVTGTATWDGSTSSDWNDATNWTTNAAPNSTHNADIPAAGVTNQPAIPNGNLSIINLTINNGRTLNLSGGSLTVTGVMTMNGGNVTVGAGNLLTISSTGSITRTTGSILGDVKKTFASNGLFVYPVGTTLGYAPVEVTVTSGAGDLSVKAVDGIHPTLPVPAHAVKRFWTLTGSGITADLTFNYNAADVVGFPPFSLFKINGAAFTIPPTGSVNATTRKATVTGISSFSDWAIGRTTPTAASASLSGRITDASGRGLRKVAVMLSGGELSEPRYAQTDWFGRYVFTDLPVGANYIITPHSSRYEFAPASRTQSLSEDATGINFLGGRRQSP